MTTAAAATSIGRRDAHWSVAADFGNHTGDYSVDGRLLGVHALRGAVALADIDEMRIIARWRLGRRVDTAVRGPAAARRAAPPPQSRTLTPS